METSNYNLTLNCVFYYKRNLNSNLVFMNLLDLPPDILVFIFEFIPVHDFDMDWIYTCKKIYKCIRKRFAHLDLDTAKTIISDLATGIQKDFARYIYSDCNYDFPAIKTFGYYKQLDKLLTPYANLSRNLAQQLEKHKPIFGDFWNYTGSKLEQAITVLIHIADFSNKDLKRILTKYGKPSLEIYKAFDQLEKTGFRTRVATKWISKWPIQLGKLVDQYIIDVNRCRQCLYLWAPHHIALYPYFKIYRPVYLYTVLDYYEYDHYIGGADFFKPFINWIKDNAPEIFLYKYFDYSFEQSRIANYFASAAYKKFVKRFIYDNLKGAPMVDDGNTIRIDEFPIGKWWNSEDINKCAKRYGIPFRMELGSIPTSTGNIKNEFADSTDSDLSDSELIDYDL